MSRTRVKICGLSHVDHARIAAQEGADAIGLVFYRESPRYVTTEAAGAIAAALPPFVAVVGLFVDAAEDEVRSVLARVPLDLLQFQGEESAGFCELFGKPYVRAVRMAAGTDLLEYARRFSRAKALLLDAHVPGERAGPGGLRLGGGSARLAGSAHSPAADSETSAARSAEVTAPGRVAASGVSGSRGVKDPGKIVEFIRRVGREDAGLAT
jgi:phosphoribosylanthranilate isomerase